MPEDWTAVAGHLQLVRAQLCPLIAVDRFPTSKKLIDRFERIVVDWETGRAPDAYAIIEVVNEMCVAIELLKLPLTGHLSLAYEPHVGSSAQSIDFLLGINDEQHYFDVKTITPREPTDVERAWAKYGELRQLFPAHSDLALAKEWRGGEFWHFFFTARARFLDYTLELERKLAKLPKQDKQTVRMVFCGDRIRWSKDQLEDFADFYRTGLFRTDDMFAPLQRHYMNEQHIVIDRTITGFCYMKRAPLDPQAGDFSIDVEGKPLP